MKTLSKTDQATLLMFLVWLLFTLLWVDTLAIEYVSGAFRRAAGSFAAVRGLNAVISVLQGTEISAQPLGFGVTLTPGQLLDPLNDVVEYLSTILLISMVSLGAQRLLAASFASPIFSCICLVVLLSIPLYRLGAARLSRVESRVVRVGFGIVTFRLLVPLFLAVMTLIHTLLLSDQYEYSRAVIDGAEGELAAEYSSSLEPDRSGWFDRLDQVMGAVSHPTAVFSDKFSQLRSLVERWSDDLVQLGMLFIVETLLFPLFWLWVAKESLPWMLRVPR